MFSVSAMSRELERIINVLNVYAACYPEAEAVIDMILTEIKVLTVMDLETAENMDELPWN